MDFVTAMIIVISGVVVSLGIGFGVWEYNRRKRGKLPTGTQTPYDPGRVDADSLRRNDPKRDRLH